MLRVEQINGISVIRIFGEVDIASVHELESCLQGLNDDIVVVIDLEVCPYFDSTGFTVLYKLVRRQHLITFMPKNCMIRRIFDIVGAEKMFPIFETEVEALNAASTIVRNGERRQIASK